MHPHFNLFQFRHFKFQFPRVGTKKSRVRGEIRGLSALVACTLQGMIPTGMAPWLKRRWRLSSFASEWREAAGGLCHQYSCGRPNSWMFFLMENPKNNGGFTGTTSEFGEQCELSLMNRYWWYEIGFPTFRDDDQPVNLLTMLRGTPCHIPTWLGIAYTTHKNGDFGHGLWNWVYRHQPNFGQIHLIGHLYVW